MGHMRTYQSGKWASAVLREPEINFDKKNIPQMQRIRNYVFCSTLQRLRQIIAKIKFSVWIPIFERFFIKWCNFCQTVQSWELQRLTESLIYFKCNSRVISNILNRRGNYCYIETLNVIFFNKFFTYMIIKK